MSTCPGPEVSCLLVTQDIGLDKLCSKIQLLCPEAVLVKSTIMLTKKPIMLELCSKKIQFQHAHPLIPGPRARAPGRARVKNTQT